MTSNSSLGPRDTNIRDISRQRIRRNQILRNLIPWKNGTFKILWTTVEKSDSQLSKNKRYDFGQDSHDDPPSSSHRSLDGDFIPILVFCFRHIEHGKDGRDDNENCSINKVTSRTDSLADAKYQCERWIVSDAPVFVEKTLRLEFLWVWVFLGVVKDCPEISQIDIIQIVTRRLTMHWLSL
jgi:hypothetical protein